jgi:hypothetical protein
MVPEYFEKVLIANEWRNDIVRTVSLNYCAGIVVHLMN